MDTKFTLFNKLKTSLLNTRKKIGDSIFDIFHNRIVDHDTINIIKNQLIKSDVNIQTTQKIINNFKKNTFLNMNLNSKSIYEIIHHSMLQIMKPVEKPLFITNQQPFVILVIGVNGVGKTTTVGKLAYHYRSQNKSVMIAAGDTKRAAAIDQLITFTKNIDSISIIANYSTSDSASIIFNAMQKALSQNINILIIDTAGRLQNNIHNIQELQKIQQTIKKIQPNAPHETILVLDSNIGQNSINQLKTFHSTITITGIIMTKLDGSSKGGVLLSISNCFSIPIRYLGIGQNLEDLQIFNATEFIEAILTK
ncbi:cell division protein FtsY [Candidatus Blochmanniella floridana]|uniref:Cell division protein FtsY n=1 Tax=Blochmanniella floridana TaxID=203907 RepID=Q7VRI6_BLOFL|nr:cell division protein FtsY [Candidatus Blochmannia floridanus]